MYIHLGQNTVIGIKEVIGIFDIDKTTVGKSTREFLACSQKKETVVDIVRDIPKSFVICAEERTKRQKVYISQIASVTLGKRGALIEETVKGGAIIERA